ncbi:hypothetical protein [Flavobacterium chungangensis]|uniref:ABC transporter permease n=1 Tax=Flavobacterium chungangensis TaxID=2708132 RepID=A0ABV8Z6Z6_9FLAO
MTTILEYLFIVRFRKLISKGDRIALLLIVLLYFAIAFLVFRNYQHFQNYILLFFLDTVGYHLQRSDIEILKLKKNYKAILFLEYLIYSLPFYLVLLFKEEFLLITGVLIFNVVLINLPKSNFKTIRYPFNLFNVYWHINFRKYKLIYLFPLLAILIYVAAEYQNHNLIYFVLLVLGIIACSPSFEREQAEEIKRNPYTAEKYLKCQLKNTVINTFYITIPIAVMLCCFQQWEKLLWVGFVFIPPLLNVILKYLYFRNDLMHQIVFVLFIVSSVLSFGASLIAMPFMYKKAIKNLKAIKYAEDSN